MPGSRWLLLFGGLSFTAMAASADGSSWMYYIAAGLLLALILVLSLYNIALYRRHKAVTSAFTSFKQLYDNAPEYIAVLDANFSLTYTNHAFNNLRPPPITASLFQNAQGPELLLPLQNPQTSWSGDAWLELDTTAPRQPLSVSLSCQRHANTWRYLLIAADISHNKQAGLSQQPSLLRDPDSGLATSLLFNEFLQATLNTAAAAHQSFGIVVLKICQTLQNALHPPRYNLSQLMQQLSLSFEGYAKNGVIAARHGSDSIVLLIPPQLCLAQPELNLNRLSHDILYLADQHLQHLNDKAMQLYAGVSIYPLDGTTSNSLLHTANHACNTAAKLGRSNLQFANNQIQHKAPEQLALEAELFKALSRDEFELYYQPRVSIGSNRVIGYEALLRWHNPKRGILTPHHFLSLAKDCGVIVALDKLMFEKACQQLSYWQSTGIARGRIAINISSLSFRQHDFVAMLQQQLEQSGILAEQFELELHEDVFLQADEDIAQKLDQLTSMGFQITLDNFGDGVSSLTVLKQYPLHNFKIASRFINELEHNEQQRNITASIVRLASYLQLNVIACGIENEMQAYLLHVMGCDILQGHLFSKAIPPAEVPALLARESRLIRRQANA